jgi:predicted DNA-binding transcriptional regulator YafY
MNRIDRLTAMILMLQGRRVVTAEQIGEHFEISVRTVYRDIAALGEAGVPIAAEAGVGYSLMRSYHMPPVQFTEEEAAALFMSGELADQFGDESLKLAVRGAMLKVRAALPVERRDYVGKLGEAIGVMGALPESGEDKAALMPVQEAVVRRRCLALEYDTGGRGELHERVVEPLGVVFYGRRWHLLGWCRWREEVRDFRLDRMRRCEVLAETFEPRDDFSMMQYMHRSGSSEELIPVTITCDPWVLDRVLAELPAQLVERESLPDGCTRIKGLAYSLSWLSGWMLGLGTAARAIEPPELCEKLAASARALADHHEKKAVGEPS